MTSEFILLLLGLAVLTGGADLLVRGASSLARRLGLTPLVIGLTVVAFGTSAPEMTVSIGGALTGKGDIAVGNVVGSNIFNIGLILGLAALITPLNIKVSLIRIDVPILIAVSLLAATLVQSAAIPRIGGAALLLGLLAYTYGSVKLARRQARAEAAAEVEEEFEQGIPPTMRSLPADLLAIAGGLALLVAGSKLLVDSATGIATRLGVSDAVIGLTIVAAGTSMPELATSVVAAFRRQADIAVGNIVGSNLFNLLGILGAAAVVRPLSAPGIGTLDLVAMVAFAVALLPLLWTQRQLQRWEGGLLLAGYAAYLWALWPD